MSSTFLITGNKNKLKELQQIFPKELNLEAKSIDLVEIQSLDTVEILKDKLKRAFEQVGQPVIAEDVSIELSAFNGLPGPFAKFFFEALGRDALWELVKDKEDKSMTAICTMGYYDGDEYLIDVGRVEGKVVSPRGENGFGFDFTFMPEGYEQSTAQMTPKEKNAISWRGIAARKLAARLFAPRQSKSGKA